MSKPRRQNVRTFPLHVEPALLTRLQWAALDFDVPGHTIAVQALVEYLDKHAQNEAKIK